MIPVNNTVNYLPNGQAMSFGNVKSGDDWTLKVESSRTAVPSSTNMNGDIKKKNPLLTDPSSNSLSEVHNTSVFPPREYQNIYQMSHPSLGAAMMPNQQFSSSRMIMSYSTGTPSEAFISNTTANNMPNMKMFATSSFAQKRVKRQSSLLHPKKAMTMKFPMKVRFLTENVGPK